VSLDPLTAGLDVVNTVGGALIKHFFPDPAQQAAAEQKMAELEKSGELARIAGQLEINKQEAVSSNWFVAGWRPFVGWVCGTGLLYVAIVEPIIRFVAQVLFGYKGPFPLIDTSLTMQVLLGMLGLGYLRTSEKKAGVAR
jgi:hypothetical protein